MKKQPTDSEARAILIAAWLAKFDDVYDTYGKPLKSRPGVFDSFEEALADLSPQDLQSAFAEWNRIGTRFPNPGDIRKIITSREEAENQLAADEAWHEIRWRLTFFSWSPDSGFLPLFVGAECKLTRRIEEATEKTEYNGGFLLHPKPMDARTERAIEAVGGLRRIAELPAGSQFDFVRRGFLEAHRTFQAIGLDRQIGKGEAKAILEGLQVNGRE